jgi:hypothetical protein
MLSALKTKPVIALIAAAAAMLAHGASAEGPPRSPSPAAGSTAAATQAGPAGRTTLARWVMREDFSDRGLREGWQRGNFNGASVSVPDVLNPGEWSGRAGVRNYEGALAWYRTTFQAPTAGTYALSFASANFLAQVWVDGRPLGAHRGSYLPFEERARVGAGTHTVVVRIDWRDPAAQSRDGFHRTWFNWGGLDGEVQVREIGASELLAPQLQTTLAPSLQEGQGAAGPAHVKVTVQVRNDGPQRTVTPEGSLTRGSQTVPLVFAPLDLEAGQTSATTATATVAEPALWSPSSPSLYELHLAVGSESAYDARVGLRQLTWHGGRMYLNGAHLQLHGATVQEDAAGHGDALTPADDQRIVAELRAIHANAVRAQHPLDAQLLERLDEAGILVWQGIGPVEGAGQWYSSTPTLRQQSEAQAHTAAIAEELHPSVIAWNLVDEVAGNGRDGAEVEYVRNLTGWLHARDPGRLVAVDVWGDHPPTAPGALYQHVDAVAETDYSGWYDSPQDSSAQLRALMRSRLAAMQRAFPGRVLVISEFGAESNTLNPGGAPGSYSFQAQLLAQHIHVYEGDPALSGMLIWVLRDYPLTPTFEGGSIHAKLPHLRLIEGLNQKGLFTRSGQAKPAVKTVAQLFGELPAG